MSFCKILLCCLISVATFQQKQFVSVNEDDVSINTEEDLIQITIPFEILNGYHIQALSDTKDNLIPTKITFSTLPGCKVVKEQFINMQYDTVVLDRISHKVLSDSFEVTVSLKCEAPESGQLILNGELYYQTCNDRQCFFPRTLNFSVNF